MTTSDAPDLADRIDQSFDDGPASAPPAAHLAAGRQALRRRRLAGAVGGAAAVLVVAGGIALATSGDGDRPRSVPVANDGPTPGETSSPSTPGSPDQAPTTATDTPPPVSDGPLAGTDDLVTIQDGALYTRLETGRIVEDVLADPATPSFAFEADLDGRPRYWLVYGDLSSDAGVHVVDDPARVAPSFEQWVATVTTDDGRGLALVRFGQGEELVAEPGRTIVEQTDEVDLPANFAAPGDPTAAAEVDYAGERWYVLARQVEGSAPEYIAFARTADVRSLPAFLAYAQQQYGNEEGVR